MATKAAKHFLITLFLLGWILPVGYYGITNRPPPWTPDFLANRANVSRLFFRESSSWWVYELQYTINDDANYRIWNEQDRFQMRPFGYRTRFQRLIANASPAFKESLIQSIRDNINNRGANNERVTAMRLIRFPYQVQRSSEVTGHFVQPNSSQIKSPRIEIIESYDFGPKS